MAKPRVRIYTDYKSPYAFVANKRLFELEENTASNSNGCPTRSASPNSWGRWRSARRISGARWRYSYWTRGAMPTRKGLP